MLNFVESMANMLKFVYRHQDNHPLRIHNHMKLSQLECNRNLYVHHRIPKNQRISLKTE